MFFSYLSGACVAALFITTVPVLGAVYAGLLGACLIEHALRSLVHDNR